MGSYNLLMFASGTTMLYLTYAAPSRSRRSNLHAAHAGRSRVVFLWVILGIKSEALGAYILWEKIHYLGVSAAPLTWLLFALQYAKHDKFLSHAT